MKLLKNILSGIAYHVKPLLFEPLNSILVKSWCVTYKTPAHFDLSFVLAAIVDFGRHIRYLTLKNRFFDQKALHYVTGFRSYILKQDLPPFWPLSLILGVHDIKV